MKKEIIKQGNTQYTNNLANLLSSCGDNVEDTLKAFTEGCICPECEKFNAGNFNTHSSGKYLKRHIPTVVYHAIYSLYFKCKECGCEYVGKYECDETDHYATYDMWKKAIYQK